MRKSAMIFRNGQGNYNGAFSSPLLNSGREGLACETNLFGEWLVRRIPFPKYNWKIL